MTGAERQHPDARPGRTGFPDGRPSAWPDARSSGHPAEVLLVALGKHRFTSQTLADHAGATRRPTIRHGPWRTQQRHLEAANRDGMGVFFMVNHGDLRGRATSNVVEVAAYFADFDGASLPGTWPLPPTAVVESSEGRFHGYWRVFGAPRDSFSHVQKRLAVLFGSDPKVHDLPRVMRLPGLYHAKREPFLSRLILVEPDNVVEHEVFVDVFGVPAIAREPGPVAPAVPAPGSGRLRLYVWAAVMGEHDRVARALEGARNSTLHESAVRLGSLVGAGVLREADARDALLVGARAADNPLPTWEAERAIDSGLRFGRQHPRQLDVDGGGHGP